MSWSTYDYNSMPQRIDVKVSREDREEYVANGAINPGYVVARDSNNKVGHQATADQSAEKLVALENVLHAGGVNDAYANTDLVPCYRPVSGDILMLRVPANAPAIVIGDKLTLDGTGCVVKATHLTDVLGTSTTPYVLTERDNVFAYAEMALDNSAVAAEAFILARIA